MVAFKSQQEACFKEPETILTLFNGGISSGIA